MREGGDRGKLESSAGISHPVTSSAEELPTLRSLKEPVPTSSRTTLTPSYATPGQTFKREHDFLFFLKRSHGRRSRNNEERGENRETVCVPVWEMTLCQRHLDNVWKTVNPVWQLSLSGGEGLAKIVHKVPFSTKSSLITLILVFVQCWKVANLFFFLVLEAVSQTCCISRLVFD